jgi:hypothetical protein
MSSIVSNFGATGDSCKRGCCVLFGYNCAFYVFFFKDFNTGNKGCDYLEEGTSNKNTSYSYSEMDHTPVSRKRKKRGRSNFHDSHNSKTSLDKPTEHTVSRRI